MAGVQRPVRVAVHTRVSCWVSLVAVPHRRSVPPGLCCWLGPPLLCCCAAALLCAQLVFVPDLFSYADKGISNRGPLQPTLHGLYFMMLIISSRLSWMLNVVNAFMGFDPVFSCNKNE